MKSSGPKNNPCETPHVISRWLVLISLCSVYCFLRERLLKLNYTLYHKILVALGVCDGWLYQMLSIGILLIILMYIYFHWKSGIFY